MAQLQTEPPFLLHLPVKHVLLSWPSKDFGPFNAFGALGRRRSEIEYPHHPGDDINTAEANEALEQVREIQLSAAKLLEELTLYK